MISLDALIIDGMFGMKKMTKTIETYNPSIVNFEGSNNSSRESLLSDSPIQLCNERKKAFQALSRSLDEFERLHRAILRICYDGRLTSGSARETCTPQTIRSAVCQCSSEERLACKKGKSLQACQKTETQPFILKEECSDIPTISTFKGSEPRSPQPVPPLSPADPAECGSLCSVWNVCLQFVFCPPPVDSDDEAIYKPNTYKKETKSAKQQTDPSYCAEATLISAAKSRASCKSHLLNPATSVEACTNLCVCGATSKPTPKLPEQQPKLHNTRGSHEPLCIQDEEAKVIYQR